MTGDDLAPVSLHWPSTPAMRVWLQIKGDGVGVVAAWARTLDKGSAKEGS